MIFILGYLTGIATSALVFIILAFFRAGIEKRIKIIETKAAQAGPKPKGVIIMPETDAELARQELIDRNRAQGKDTQISELE